VCLIAMVLVTITWINLRDDATERVLDRVLIASGQFSLQAKALLDQPGLPDTAGLQRELEAFTRMASAHHETSLNRMGHFVYARIYDTRARRIARVADDTYVGIGTVSQRLEDTPLSLPRPGQRQRQIFRLDGLPLIAVTAPLTSSSDEVVAYLEGVFAVSATAMAAARLETMKTLACVIAIVLLTAIVLYPVIINLLDRLARTSRSLLDSHMETLNVLGSAIAKRDSDTDAHNYRVTIMAVRLAEAFGLTAREMRALIKGAFLHDVGKIGIADSILHKPGKLDETEYTEMKTHVDKGLEIISRSRWLEDAVDVVGGHHERMDGSGYPKGRSGSDTPVSARIFAIADVFDALVSKRPYKEPLSYEETLAILEKGRGTHFDPALLDLFEKIAPKLYSRLINREEGQLRQMLGDIAQTYFMDKMDAILASDRQT
jgi:HD-GYP domain-containing protein (c-di-GMP phosphodiesterase class II)